MVKAFLTAFLMLFTIMVYGADAFSPLPPDQAFVLSASFNSAHELVLDWKIAPGYYLYKNQARVQSNTAQISSIHFPPGVLRHDLVHGAYIAYFNQLKLTVPIASMSEVVDLTVRYQGCSSKGFCYVPIQKTFAVNLQNYTFSSSTVSEKLDYFTKLFRYNNLFVIIITFLGIGLLLAFTPCVLPMVPILSAIILGHKKTTSKSRGFLLSLSYVLGMALTYAVAGVVIAVIGGSVQAYLEQPWVIILVAGLFVLLALSLFDVYELSLPAKWQQHITEWSGKQKSGTYLGVFLMGSLSTLIVSPCVTAPLVGVLTYIGKTGDKMLGAVSLLALGIGMGIPLLILGISAQKWLPKTGRWMVMVERLFGVAMIIVAVWLLARLVPDSSTQYFTKIHSMQEFNQQLTRAAEKHQLVMLDFYADWCTSCVTMNRNVFSQPDVQKALISFRVLQADVTANDVFDQEIAKQFHVIGPPTILFFADGKELQEQRIIGEVSKKEFMVKIKGIDHDNTSK